LATFILIIVISSGSGLLTWKAVNNLINQKRNNKVKLQGESTQNQASLAPGQGADMSSLSQQAEKARSHISKKGT